MGIPLLRSHLIEPADRDRRVAVISESVARKVWPSENPLGKLFRPGADAQWPLVQVIGIAADVRAGALDEVPLLMIYEPIGHAKWRGMSASLVVRSTISPTSLSSALRNAIRTVDSQVPIVHLRPMQEIVSESVSVRRFQLGLASLFGVFALLLAVLGIYGVVGYSVARRRQELAIRIALGAKRSDLRNLVLLQGMSPVVAGWMAGVAASFIAGVLIRSLLFGVTAQDPLTIGLTSIVVLATAAVACYVPARRAARVDPMLALRYE
jgi:putative ABC transport system permease protein